MFIVQKFLKCTIFFCFQVHTGERPHQCTECGATFSFQSNFISHRFEVLNTKTSQKSFPGKCTSENRGLQRRRRNSGSTIFVTPAARTTPTRYDNIILTSQELSRQQQQGKLEASQATRAREVQRGGALRRLRDFFQNQGALETGLILDF